MKKFRCAFKKVIIISAVLCSFLLQNPLKTFGSGESINSLSGECIVLYSPQRQEVLYGKNIHQRKSIASTTKIMTAIAVIEAKDLNEVITIPKEACGIEGSSIYLVEGEQLTVFQLLQALMLQSANDAAVALAIATDGSIEAFSHRMNSIAEELKLNNTHFVNPHGLDNPEHYSSAYDLALITARGLENPIFRQLINTKNSQIPGGNNTVRFLRNHNKLLNLCPEAIGVKTGFTKKSGRCLVGAAEKDQTTLVAVTLNAPDDWYDHKKLFSFGYSLLHHEIIVEKERLLFALPISGSDKSELIAANAERVFGVCRDTQNVKPTLEFNRPIFAPIKRGEVLGRIYFYQNDILIAESALIATESANKD